MIFCYFFLLLLLHTLGAACCSQDCSRMGKHHGSEGRKSVKIATKNSLISNRNGASATLKQQGPEGRKITYNNLRP